MEKCSYLFEPECLGRCKSPAQKITVFCTNGGVKSQVPLCESHHDRYREEKWYIWESVLSLSMKIAILEWDIKTQIYQ